MELIAFEIGRVPLRVEFLKLVRRHAAEHELDPAIALFDLRTATARLIDNDVAGHAGPTGDR
jgi:hypothetical protein